MHQVLHVLDTSGSQRLLCLSVFICVHIRMCVCVCSAQCSFLFRQHLLAIFVDAAAADDDDAEAGGQMAKQSDLLLVATLGRRIAMNPLLTISYMSHRGHADGQATRSTNRCQVDLFAGEVDTW